MGRKPYSDRLTTEECKRITTKFLREHDYFDGICRGGMSWSRHGKTTGSIGFTVSTVEHDEHIRFQYRQTDRDTGATIHLDYKTRLDWTFCFFGNRRWWFRCPCCNRRVGALYLGDRPYFACRHCNNLTYRSQKECHAFDRLFARFGVDPKEARSFFKRWL